MEQVIELKNVEIHEYCTLNTNSGKLEFYTKKRIPGFTGHYFKNNNTFFALYPTKNGPMIFYQNKEYQINKALSIIQKVDGKDRIFILSDYNIEIHYVESHYLNWDVWSTEDDVDLFSKITHHYQEDSFYKRYTL